MRFFTDIPLHLHIWKLEKEKKSVFCQEAKKLINESKAIQCKVTFQLSNI